MAFVPYIDFCVQKNADDEYEIVVTDTTNVYDVTFNPTGWENALTALAANVTAISMVVTYTNSDGVEAETTYDVLDQLTDPVTNQFEYDPIDYSGDGIYKITVTYTINEEEYIACKQKAPYVDVRCCISDIVNQLKDSPSSTELQTTVNKVKALEKAYNAAANSVDKPNTIALLKLLEAYCDYTSDGCGCN